jgi:hypothetical protein
MDWEFQSPFQCLFIFIWKCKLQECASYFISSNADRRNSDNILNKINKVRTT